LSNPLWATLLINNKKGVPDTVPNSTPGAAPPIVPGPGQPISSGDAPKVATQKSKKPSLLQRLVAGSGDQVHNNSAQSPITMIQNSADPFGPMIPILTEPPSTVVSMEK
jgi:hypothetical protein